MMSASTLPPRLLLKPAERAGRGPAIHRKLSHDTTSRADERSPNEPSRPPRSRLQNSSLFAYLRELITAHNRGHPFLART